MPTVQNLGVGFEAGVRAIDAPEGFEGKVLGDRRIADDANDPAIDFVLMQTEKSLEGVEVTAAEPLQNVGWLCQRLHLLAFYISLRHQKGRRLHKFVTRPLGQETRPCSDIGKSYLRNELADTAAVGSQAI
jgi:hypothetical protein